MSKLRLDLDQSVLQMVSYLQTIQRGHQKSFEEHVRAGDLDSMFETTDLSEIRSYLKDLYPCEKNDDQRLGNLVRGNKEGSNKEVWLCPPHYDAIFDTKAAKELRVLVNWDKGFYEFKDRKLTLILKMSQTTVFRHYSRSDHGRIGTFGEYNCPDDSPQDRDQPQKLQSTNKRTV